MIFLQILIFTSMLLKLNLLNNKHLMQKKKKIILNYIIDYHTLQYSKINFLEISHIKMVYNYLSIILTFQQNNTVLFYD